MNAITFRNLGTLIVAAAMLTPAVIGRTNYVPLAPVEGLMHVDVTYTEEANINDKTKNDNGAQTEDVSNFRFRANVAFEQRVVMQPIAGSGINFNPVENARQTNSGGVSYNGETKRTGTDDQHRPNLEEKSQISFAGVLSDDSASGVPDDNAAGIQFGIQSDMTGGCQGKRTMYYYGGKEKKVQTVELNSCGHSDELHEAAMITREPLNLDLRQKSDGKEFVHYAAQFHVTSCNLNPQYCLELKAAEAAANSSGPNSEATSENWIGATTTGNMAAGFKISLTMFKELKVEGAWKRSLQMTASVTPATKSRAALEGTSPRSVETADRLRANVI
jgi:hypothetical protein